MTLETDQAEAVREGETLDEEALTPWLKEHIPDIDGPISIKQFPSGWSNLTYLIETGNRELVLRRPPFGANVRGGHDMGREYKILSALTGTYGKVPQPLAFCEDDEVLGAPFYVMERLNGIILRGGKPALDAEGMSHACEALIKTFTELHSQDPEELGLSDLGKPEGYVERQIGGWTSRYQKAKTDDLREMDGLAIWLDENRPEEAGTSLIHNDFKYDNLVLDPSDPGRVIGVLDWEMATIGCPLMDLGSSLGYWTEADDIDAMKLFSPTHLPGNLDREGVVAAYEQASGRSVDNPVFYFAYGQFKLAVVLQQIYARYAKGMTKDPRFARLIDLVRVCAGMALTAITRKRISHIDLGV